MYETEQIIDARVRAQGGARSSCRQVAPRRWSIPAPIEFETDGPEIVRVLELVDGVYRQRVFVEREERARAAALM